MKTKSSFNIFKYNLQFKWLELYIGLRKGWLGSQEILKLIENQRVINGNNENYIELYWELDSSLNRFVRTLIEYANNESNQNYEFNLEYPLLEEIPEIIPFDFWKIWELEFLLDIKFSVNSIPDKIYMIYLLWCDFKYLGVKWDKFLWIDNFNNQDSLKLYQSFEYYIANLKDEIKEKR